MTFEEKLMIEHPELANTDDDSMIRGCPYQFGYETEEDSHKYCSGHTCAYCWNREIPETEPTKNEREEKQMDPITTRKTKAELLDEIKALRKEVENLEKYKTIESAANDSAIFIQAFVDAGFTREEAFKILITSITNKS